MFISLIRSDAPYGDPVEPLGVAADMRPLEAAHQLRDGLALLGPDLQGDMGGTLPRVPSFVWLATALAEEGRIEEAIEVCEAAARLGLEDGTKGGYAGRAAKLRARKARPSVSE